MLEVTISAGMLMVMGVAVIIRHRLASQGVWRRSWQ
jgi:hypothetical protein